VDRRRNRFFLIAFAAGLTGMVDFLPKFGIPVYPFGYLSVMSFAAIMAWTLRKVAYCLEERSFLTTPAESWLQAHDSEPLKRMEDLFFLPFIHERLNDAFGTQRTRKKPEMYGGEIDLLFDQIPIEVKVRRGARKALSELIDASFRPASQASAYASSTRLGLVFVLDMPEAQPALTNLDSCLEVVVRDVGTGFPTCVVVAIFHGQHPTPSKLK